MHTRELYNNFAMHTIVIPAGSQGTSRGSGSLAAAGAKILFHMHAYIRCCSYSYLDTF